MKQRFVRMNQIASAPGRAGLLPVTAPTVWRWVQQGEFPKPIRLGPGTTAWRLEDIEGFIKQRAASS